MSATDVPAKGSTPAYCSVAMLAIDPNDPRGGLPGEIHVDLALPDTNWNGNYMAEGGGVYCSPITGPPTDQLAAGYATSNTDCGHQMNALISPWVTNPSGGLNWNRIKDFGYIAMHAMAAMSKLVVDQYYGVKPHYSFWNGCSTGGRQGLSEAQKYPGDFNGILAGAPALAWPEFMNAQLWPELVMEWNNDYLPTCKEDAVNNALATHCPDQNGKIDGVFDPRTCDVMAVVKSLIGTSTPCGTFTATDALVIQEIWQGPRNSGSQSDLLNGKEVWFGLEPGASLADPFAPGVPTTFPPGIPGFPAGVTGFPLAVTYQQPNGQWAGAPFVPSADWYEKWVKQDPNWVYTQETYQQFWQDFTTSSSMFDGALAADNPDLTAFKKRGGKLIMWQGLADQLIFTGDSINYYNQVLKTMGGVAQTQQFFRYFAVPGVGHCGRPGEKSIAPTDPMQAVVDWVEKGKAPDTLPASGTINGQPVTRPLCPYPAPDAVYTSGDPNQASSYTCQNKVVMTDPFKPGKPG